MFNCSKLFNTTSSTIINNCMSFCNYIMDDCICKCINNYLYDEYSYENTYKVIIIFICTGVILFGCCGIIVKINKKYAISNDIFNFYNNNNNNNNITPRTIPITNTNDNTILRINYYDLPKYEDIDKNNNFFLPHDRFNINTPITPTTPTNRPPNYE
jgi:hypothetical protein